MLFHERINVCLLLIPIFGHFQDNQKYLSDYLRLSQTISDYLRLSQIISDYLRLVAQFYPSKYRDEARRGEQCLKQTEDVFGPVRISKSK